MKKFLIISISGLLLCCCHSNPPKLAKVVHTGRVRIDTIEIHGHTHEILIRSDATGSGGYGGIMHSPECWCSNITEK